MRVRVHVCVRTHVHVLRIISRILVYRLVNYCFPIIYFTFDSQRRDNHHFNLFSFCVCVAFVHRHPRPFSH